MVLRDKPSILQSALMRSAESEDCSGGVIWFFIFFQLVSEKLTLSQNDLFLIFVAVCPERSPNGVFEWLWPNYSSDANSSRNTCRAIKIIYACMCIDFARLPCYRRCGCERSGWRRMPCGANIWRTRLVVDASADSIRSGGFAWVRGDTKLRPPSAKLGPLPLRASVLS